MLNLRRSSFCDDGNTVDGDGCSSTCTVECGYNCSGGTATTQDDCHVSVWRWHQNCDGAVRRRQTPMPVTAAAARLHEGRRVQRALRTTCQESSCQTDCGDGIQGRDGGLRRRRLTESDDGCSSTMHSGSRVRIRMHWGQCPSSQDACTSTCGDGLLGARRGMRRRQQRRW